MNTLCIIIFHSDIFKFFNKSIINKSLDSLYNQTFQNFDVMELCYDGTNTKLWKKNKNYKFFNQKFNNYVDAINFLLKKGFYEFNYKNLFIVNLDDIYHNNRLNELKNHFNDYDIISSNYYILEDNNKIRKREIISENYDINYNLDNIIRYKIRNNERIIDISGVIINKNVIDSCGYLDYNYKHYSHFILWKKACKKGLKFFISNKYLLYYRLNKNKNKNKIF
jgi:hypothetical protein